MDCLICGENKGFNDYKIKEKMFGSNEEFDYIECLNCGCLQIRSFDFDFSKYYRSEYYSFSEFQESKIYLKEFFKNKRNKYSVLKKDFLGMVLNVFFPSESLQPLSSLNLSENSKILDVGCGSGWLLYSLKEAGMKHVFGVDQYINKSLNYENGLKILKLNFFDIGGKWDLIMFNHSFEHFFDPIETLNKVVSMLDDGGTCMITIPTVSSFAWEYYRENWVQIDAPRHIFIPSTKSMEILANSCGLKLEKIMFNSTEFQFLGSEQYKKQISITDKNSYFVDSSKSIFKKRDIISFRKKSKELNRKKIGDQAVFFLKKI